MVAVEPVVASAESSDAGSHIPICMLGDSPAGLRVGSRSAATDIGVACNRDSLDPGCEIGGSCLLVSKYSSNT